MARYLIVLATGPVQDFIAAARRTRDLWFGSEILSEVSKAAAKALHDGGAELIFPAPANPSDLNPGSRFNVGNKILAECSKDLPKDVQSLLDEGKKAARKCWEKVASDVRVKLAKDGLVVRGDIWDKQVDDVIEAYTAWVALGGRSYDDARNRLEKLLAARKATRDFGKAAMVPDESPMFGLPKSSLDGARETVLPDKVRRHVRRKLGLSEGEQLDCPGLVKRLGGNPEQFTPISRIAVDPWLCGVIAGGGRIVLDAVAGGLDALVKDGLVSRVSGNTAEEGEEEGESIYASLPYDGQLLYRFRLEAEKNRLDGEIKRSDGSEERQEAEQTLGRLNALDGGLKALWSKHGEPSPYFAVLQADGDRMGELLDELKDADEHRRVSAALAEFAQEVRGRIRGFRGHCVYSGGDDVLAFVPMNRVIECARTLHDLFSTKLGRFGKKGARPPTLSVGIAIGHVLDPMGRHLDLARRAERLAKGNDLPKDRQRDGLAVILDPRSGAPIAMRGQWSEKPDERLKRWVALHTADLVPDKAAFELRQAARELDWARTDRPDLIALETKRILGRKQPRHGQQDLAATLRHELGNAAKQIGLDALAEELILARRFAEAELHARPRTGSTAKPEGG